MRRLVAALLVLLLPAAATRAGPVEVSAEPIDSFHRIFADEGFGPLAWRGGLTLTAPDPGFGGFSGLVTGKECETLVAVSDAGSWLRGRLLYEGGRLSGFAAATMDPILDSKGRLQRDKDWSDAEAVTPLPDGSVAVGFERRVRFGGYDVDASGAASRFAVIPHPKDLDKGPENGEVEALAALPDGRFLALAERQFDGAGNIRGWAWRGRDVVRFAIAQHDAYKVTDMAVLADGTVLTLERRFTSSSLPGMAVRRFPASAIADGVVLKPELLLEATAPLYVIDNMEGIAACARGGETRVTLMSDDNFNPVQSTILLQFAYAP